MPVSAPHTGTRGGQRVGGVQKGKTGKGRVAGTQMTEGVIKCGK